MSLILVEGHYFDIPHVLGYFSLSPANDQKLVHIGKKGILVFFKYLCRYADNSSMALVSSSNVRSASSSVITGSWGMTSSRLLSTDLSSE